MPLWTFLNKFLCWHVSISLTYVPKSAIANSHDNAVFNTSTLRRKTHFMWTWSRNLPTEMDSPWSTEGPNFINNRAWWPFADRGFLHTLYTGKNLRLNFLSASGFHTVPSVFTPSESTTQRRKLWLSISTNRLRPALSNQNCTVWIPHPHKMDLIKSLRKELLL